MKFAYEARTPAGEIQSGTVEAPSHEAALKILERYNLVIVGLEEEKGGLALKKEIKLFARIKRQEIVAFSRQLAVLFEAQVPLLDALKTLAAQTPNPKFEATISDIAAEVDAGTPLSQAFAKYPKLFSNFYVSVVRAGEASGRLNEVLNYLADHEERAYDLTRKVRGALIYPAFIVASLVLVGAIMLIFVVPQITSIFEESEAELPFLTVTVIALSDFAKAFWWLIVVLLGGAGFGLARFFKTPDGALLKDTLLLQIPILKNLFQKVYLTRLAENLSTLIKGGIPIIQALTITGEVVGNLVYRRTIEEAAEEVRKGGSISGVLKNNKYIPSLVTQMVMVGENTGRLDSILGTVASFYQKDVDNMVSNLTALIQPILILILGGAAGLLVAAILLPIYNLSSSL